MFDVQSKGIIGNGQCNWQLPGYKWTWLNQLCSSQTSSRTESSLAANLGCCVRGAPGMFWHYRFRPGQVEVVMDSVGDLSIPFCQPVATSQAASARDRLRLWLLVPKPSLLRILNDGLMLLDRCMPFDGRRWIQIHCAGILRDAKMWILRRTKSNKCLDKCGVSRDHNKAKGLWFAFALDALQISAKDPPKRLSLFRCGTSTQLRRENQNMIWKRD